MELYTKLMLARMTDRLWAFNRLNNVTLGRLTLDTSQQQKREKEGEISRGSPTPPFVSPSSTPHLRLFFFDSPCPASEREGPATAAGQRRCRRLTRCRRALWSRTVSASAPHSHQATRWAADAVTPPPIATQQRLGFTPAGDSRGISGRSRGRGGGGRAATDDSSAKP